MSSTATGSIEDGDPSAAMLVRDLGEGRWFPNGAGGVMIHYAMKVVASPPATEFVQAHGGRLWVWASSSLCCGGTRFIEASSEPPVGADRFLRVPGGEFQLYVRPAGPDGLPDELHVDLSGIRRRRVRAFWNGCAYLI